MTPTAAEPTDVVIVEDSPLQAEQLRLMLARHGYESRLAHNGREALALIRARRPQLVLSDVTMPEMDGYELCRQLRADPMLAALPVILLTALADPEDVILGLECGADHFVVKPPDEEYLLSRVRSVMVNRPPRQATEAGEPVEIELGGRSHRIRADRRQILNLLLSTYESAVGRGRQLVRAQDELRRANETLEERVRVRTAALTKEIDGRKRLHAALERSEQQYRQLFEANPVPMWVFDLETLRFLMVNDAAVRHYGYAREEFLAMTIAEIRPADAVPALREYVAHVPTAIRSEWVHRKKNGELITVEVSGHRVTYEDRPAQLVIANDVTLRKQAEEALRASEEKFAVVFHASPMPKLIAQADGRMTEVNEQMCLLLGYSREEMIGRTLAELDAWADPTEAARAAGALRAREAWRDEVRLRRRSGEQRWVLVSLQPLRLSQQPAFVAAIVDLTEHRALEAQVQRFQRMESVGRLASGIAHDMNNVPAPVIMGVPLLRLGLPVDEAEKVVSAIEVSAGRGAALMRQLLIFGRGIEGVRRPVDLRDLVAEVTTMCRQTFPRNIEITTAVAEDLGQVRADPTQVQQVVLNLAVNARDAMPGGGALRLGLENATIDEHDAALHQEAKPGRYVVIRVTDTGTGITPDVAERMFDPFFTTKEAGTGLGLSTVLGIVKNHGGFLRLDTAAGRGTTFAVYLPALERAETRDTGPAGPAPAAAAPRGNGEVILVVDDEEAVRRLLCDTLARNNYGVVSAPGAVEATAAFAATPTVKLVLTDLDMPVMGGVNLARVLRRMNPAVKIVVSTGSSGHSKQAAELAGLGIRHVLAKPYRAETLLLVIATALGELGAGA